jgi:tetratricopeptide (TPR) repeat protein
MILKLAVLLLVPAAALAADVNSLTVTGIAEFTEAYQAWDGEGFMKAAATFAQAPDSSTNQYWRGAADFHRLLFLLGEPPTATNRRLSAKALDETITSLERAVQLKPNDGESHALLGTVYGMSIAANPVRAVWLGPRVMDEEKQARKLSPDNPRVLYLDGMSRFYGPSLLGGKSAALELLLAAEKLFEAEAGKPADPVEPRWGRSTCLVYIGRTYAALGKPADAETYYRKALAVNPRDRLAQDELAKRKK